MNMKQETIERVLKITIENGYDGKDLSIDNDGIYFISPFGPRHLNLIETITSRPFIDSFAEYLWGKYKVSDIQASRFIWGFHIQDIIDLQKKFRHKLIDAIYEDKLEEFFISLI